MRRAKKLCSAAGCTNVQPCPTHGRVPWARDTPRSTLSGSAQQKRARYIIDRDDTICHVCQRPGANQADHVVPITEGGADTAENMAAIHAEPCHAEKTKREAQTAQARARAGAR